jgi:succinoglycan biosynthesis transport protein ExoP
MGFTVQDSSSFLLKRPVETTSATALYESSRFAQEETVHLGEYWNNTIRPHLSLVLCIFAVAELLTLLIIFNMVPLYTAESSILIERQTPEVLDTKNPESVDPDMASFYKTQYEILKSRSLAASVIRDLALDKDPLFTGAGKSPGVTGILLRPLRRLFPSAPPSLHDDSARVELFGISPGLIDTYLSMLTIRPGYETRLAMIAFTSPDALLSAKVTNAHVQAFIRRGYERHTESNQEAQHFLAGQLYELEKRVEKSEAALNDYRRARGIVAFSLDDKDAIVSDRINALSKGVVQAEETRIALQADVEAIKSNNYDSLPAVVNNLLIQNLKVQAAELEGRYANLANEATPNYPPLAQLHAQLLRVQAREKQEMDGVVESIRTRYSSAVERENQLKRDLDDEKNTVMSLKDASLQDVVLAREVETNRALYQSVLERIKVLGVASEAQVTNVSIIDMAETPLSPSSPKRRLSLVLSGFLALLVGFGAILVIDSTDSALKNAEEVYNFLHLPTLATVVRFSGLNEKRLVANDLLTLHLSNNNRQPPALTNGANGVGIGSPPPAGLFAVANEAYRAVRTALLLSRAAKPPKSILFSSAMPGEGKSVTAVNTAIAFAHLMDRVILVDADLRKPRCHVLLDQEGRPGLTEVLAGLRNLEDAIRPTPIRGLYFLGAGATPPNPGELLGSQKMKEVLASLGGSFSHVIVDSAPILPVSDTVVLATLADGVVIISGVRTPKKFVRDACARLFSVGSSTILGVILNNVSPQIQQYYAPYLYR